MVTITSRASWGATPWTSTPASVPMSERAAVMVHWHGAAPAADRGVAVPRTVERMHLEDRGWSGVGYNFLVDQLGAVYEGRGWSLQGAHCTGHNRSAIGVYVAVGQGGAPASEAALRSVRALHDEAERRAGRKLAQLGHRDGLATECPGPALYSWVRGGMTIGSPTAPPPPAGWDGKSFPGTAAFVLGKSHPAVTVLGERLVLHGHGSHYKVGPGPTFGQADRSATAAFQRSQGWSGRDADGYPGPETWRRLMLAPPKAKAAPKPAASASSAAKPLVLAAAVRPGARHEQVRDLQRLLVAADYGPIRGAVTDYYGAQTEAAVARFHDRNRRFRSSGVTRDVRIGRLGFAELQRQAAAKGGRR